MKVYSVRDWDKLYETAETRKLKRLTWVPTPNKHDGNGYRRLMSMDEPGNLFTAFRLIVEVASKMPVRGVLQDRDGPLDEQDLAFKTGFAAEYFARAFALLSNPEHKIQWLDMTNLPEPAGIPGEAPEVSGGNGIEWTGLEGKGREVTPLPPRGGTAGDPDLNILVTQYVNATGFMQKDYICRDLAWLKGHWPDLDLSAAIPKYAREDMTSWEFKTEMIELKKIEHREQMLAASRAKRRGTDDTKRV